MHFLEAAHTAPEFLTHVAASCGAAMFGVLGARATRAPRAMMAARVAERRRRHAEEMLVRRARREELAAGAVRGDVKHWDDVDVDAMLNRTVPLKLPAMATPQFEQFDKLLSSRAGGAKGALGMQSTGAQRIPGNGEAKTAGVRQSTPSVAGASADNAIVQRTPPPASEFLADDEDAFLA